MANQLRKNTIVWYGNEALIGNVAEDFNINAIYWVVNMDEEKEGLAKIKGLHDTEDVFNNTTNASNVASWEWM